MKPQYAMLISILRGLVLSYMMVVVLLWILNAFGIWLAMPIVEFVTTLVVFVLVKKEGRCKNDK